MTVANAEQATVTADTYDRKVDVVSRRVLCVQNRLGSMARQLVVHSKVEVCVTIRFLSAKRLIYTDIHREIIAVYDERAISRPGIVKWCTQFNARISRTNIAKAGPQRPVPLQMLTVWMGSLERIGA